MNKNITPLILIILAVGVYFTFTKGKIEELKSIKTVNADYQQALNNSEKLIKVRDSVRKTYNDIDEKDRQRLDKMLPDSIDNVRLIIDVNGVAKKYNLVLKNIKTSANSSNSSLNVAKPIANPNSGNTNQVKLTSTYETVSLSFSVNTNYMTFIELMRDLETSLRLMDISKITLTANDNGIFEYGVELKTYWLKQ